MVVSSAGILWSGGGCRVKEIIVSPRVYGVDGGASVVMYCGKYSEMGERVIVVMSCER